MEMQQKRALPLLLFLYKGVSFFESLLNSFLLFFWYLTLLSSAGFLVSD
jgi:hypothetical protein